MASQIDTGQLKKLGIVLLVLGAVMALASFLTDTSWQLYGGLGAAVVGLGVAGFAMAKK